MKTENFRKCREELEKEKEQNNNKILICDERTRMSKVNQFEYKAGSTLVFSMIGYIAIFVTSAFLINNIGATTFINIIPALSYPIAMFGTSLVIGTLIRILIDKKFKTKERLKIFSNAKTQIEKLEEEIFYQIELEKAYNRNKTIDETIKNLNSNESMLEKISDRYDLNDKNASQTKEDAEQKVEELSTIIKEQYDKLDLLTTKKVLHDRFWRIRAKLHKISDMMVISMTSGIFTMLLVGFPIMLLRDVFIPSLPTIYIPFIVGIGGINVYMLKRNKDHKKVFNNLNSQLGENALVDNLDNSFDNAFEEQQEIETMIENQIRDISLAELQLQEQRRFLETCLTEEDKKRQILEPPFPKPHINEQARQDILERPERYTNCDVRISMEKFYTNEECEKYSEETLSKPLPGEEKGHTLVKKIRPTN